MQYLTSTIKTNTTLLVNKTPSLLTSTSFLTRLTLTDHSQIKPDFIPETPACYAKPFDFDLSFSEFPKETTSELVFKAKSGELLTTKYSDYCAFYTDGSKLD